MSIIYGNQTNHWRSYINTSTSQDGKTLTASVTVGIQDCGWGFQINSGIRGTANANGQTNSANTSFYTSTGSWTTKNIVSTSKKFSKKHSAYNITLSGTVTNSSGYMNGTSSASQTISVPALARHYVSFDANGGENAPAKADKWYGEQVTIPTSTPTRSNYQFLGWSTSKTGSVQYLPGNKYWVDDKNITLYAIWKLLYIEPKFTEGLCIRTTDLTSTTEDPSGEYIYGSFSWHVDTSVYEDNTPSEIVVTSSKDGLDAVNVPFTGTTSLAEGTLNFHLSAALDSNYLITCTVVDNQNGTAELTRSVSNGSIPIDVSNKGRSIGIMSTAPSVPGVKIGSIGTGAFSISSMTHDGNFSSNASVSGETNNSGQGVLTLDTSGLNSSGDSSKGTINLIADSWKFNDQFFLPNGWVVEASDNKDPNIGWVWKKYGDGTAECWFKATSSSFNIGQKLGNGFYTGNEGIAARKYPFSFSEIPEELINLDLQGVSSGNMLTSWFSLYQKNTISQSKAYKVFALSALNGVIAHINYHIFGKYQ